MADTYSPLYEDVIYASPSEDSQTSVYDSNAPKKRSCCRRCCCSVPSHLFWFIVFTTIGLALYFTTYFENGMHNVVISQIPLIEGSERTEMWINGKLPVTYKIYVFNLTNPYQFLRGSLPRVEEVGPFVYSVIETREQVVYNKGQIFFRSKPIFKFEDNLSVPGGENLMVNTLNIPLVNAGEMTRGPILGTALNFFKAVYNFDSIKSLTIRELLWGHSSKVLNWAKSMKDIPYPYNYFALLAGRNNTLQPLTSVNSGTENVSETSQVLSYDGPGPQTGCNRIRGSDGSGFGPDVKKSQVLFIYNGQFCRSLPMIYNETVTNNGIEAYRFVLPDDVFTYSKMASYPRAKNAGSNYESFHGNSRFNSLRKSLPAEMSGKLEDETPSWRDYYEGANQCFCYRGKCLPDGVLDMKPCLYEAAVGFSFPHFLNADPVLRHMVKGMR